MKPTRTREELDALLGRGGIGATRRDEILSTVLAHAKAEAPARPRWRWPLVGLGSAAVVAATLLVLVPRFSSPTQSPFRAKGTVSTGTAATTPFVQIECLGATLHACPAGSLLVVRVAGVRGFVSAWAEPTGGGERVWYFSADTYSPLVEAVPTTTPTRAVKIGPEHAAGAYVVEIRVTERAMGRDELLHLTADAALASAQAVLTITSP
jgi:hypothetical protein